MSEILNLAWNEVINLPEEKQEQIAYMILEEMEDDKFWEVQFKKSEKELASIAHKVMNEIKAKRYREHGFGDL